MDVYQRVVPVSLTVLFDSSIDYCTLVCRCCIAIYRPRRKKGRIKCDVEKRYFVIGEQKVDENAGDVPHFDPDGDKNTLSTPNITNGLLPTRDPLPHSVTIPFLDKLNVAVAGQSEHRTTSHDALLTNSNASYLGTMGRHGSWIQRSPTHTQRESSNAKFYRQWHERVVVFCFGLLTRTMLTRLTIKFTTLISLGNETCLSRYFRLFTGHFHSLFFPAQNKQTQQHQPDSQGQQLRESWSKTTIARKDAQTITVNDVVSKSFLPRSLPIRATSLSCQRWKDSPLVRSHHDHHSFRKSTLSSRSKPTIARKLVEANNCTKGRPDYLDHQRCF